MYLVLLLLWLFAKSVVLGVPNYWACQSHPENYGFCNSTWSIEDRLEDLLNSLNVSEKISMLYPQYGDLCLDHTAGVPRLNLPSYMWLVEVNTVVSSSCNIAPDKCATQFAGPLNTAASFNKTSWRLKGEVLGTEQRAFVNIHGQRSGGTTDDDFLGLTAYGPNINQQRDPRYGRSSELPGEDPYLSGQYAKEILKGMQEMDDYGYPKVLGYLKHFAAYNRETDRSHDDYNITLFDLFDTYLAQFELAINSAYGVMCSYNGINGSPSCANSWLLNEILRKRWQRPDLHVTSDCNALQSFRGPPLNLSDDATAAAWGISNGTDLEMGSQVYSHLMEAIDRDLVSEEIINEAFRRSYRGHFVLGRFDDPSLSPWSKFSLDDIRSVRHETIRLESALQGLVLLKNEGVLPIQIDAKVAILGPLGQTRDGLMSDYENDQSCFGGGHECIPTIYESVAAIGTNVMNATGVDVDSNDTQNIRYALELAASADVVVLCLGITKHQEREGVDRIDTALPGLQEEFAKMVFRVGKPTVLVLVNGGQVAIDNLVEPSGAIIEAFNPNDIGGKALALSLFGLENRWGKLPYTLYPYSTMQAFDMKDHSMTNPPGRTYRYHTGDVIFPFGFGLSLTRMVMDCHINKSSQMSFVCIVENIGDLSGEDVVQVYHSAGAAIRTEVDHPVPLKSLIDFDRVHVDAHKNATILFTFDLDILKIRNSKGDRILYPGRHSLLFTNGVLTPIEFQLFVDNSLQANLVPQ